MDSSECEICHAKKKLACCKECMQTLIMQRIYESMQGDIADRVCRKLEDRFLDIENALKDKQIIVTQRGRKLKIV